MADDPTRPPVPPIGVLRAARQWATDHRHPQPDDRMLAIVFAAGRTAAADELGQANARADATRQMAIEANARLRALLLAALGIEDDGRTPIVGYVHALIADREAAYERGRTAAAADPPEWLIEILHVAWAFARREHEVGGFVPEHARIALADVPAEVLRAARIAEGKTDAD